jgi:methionine synthase II (cobalamin-independent)
LDRTTPPYRADHVGSFLRPQRLLEARTRRARGEIDAAALRAVEDAAIRDVVRRQEEVGLSGVTDGEFRRTFFHLDFSSSWTASRSARAASPRRSSATTAPRSGSSRRPCA